MKFVGDCLQILCYEFSAVAHGVYLHNFGRLLQLREK